MERPVFQYKTDEEHEDPQCPEDGDRGDLAILTIAYPQPSQQKHRQTVDRPQWEYASNRIIAGELPCFSDGVAEDFTCARIGQHRFAITRVEAQPVAQQDNLCRATVNSWFNLPAITSGPWKFSSG